jgi:hypothetical protein
MTANCTGALLIALVIFRMPLIPMMVSLGIASISAVLGGVLAWAIFIELKKLKIVV